MREKSKSQNEGREPFEIKKEKEEKMEKVRLRKGMVVRGFAPDVPGIWKIVSLRPFRVQAIQCGKRWIINVSRKEFLERLGRGA